MKMDDVLLKKFIRDTFFQINDAIKTFFGKGLTY